MNVLITGGAGFLGQRLTGRLLRRGALTGSDGRAQPIDRITLVDTTTPAITGDMIAGRMTLR